MWSFLFKEKKLEKLLSEKFLSFTGGIRNRTIHCVVVTYIKLWKFYFIIDNQRIGHIPNEHEVMNGVWHWIEENSGQTNLKSNQVLNFLTALNHHRADLNVVRVGLEFHSAG